MASTTIDSLPLDVLSKILIRFPAKPLARMRCVSKPWNSFLSEPAFIKSYLRRSIENNDEILIVCASASMAAHPSKSPHSVIPNFIQIPVDPNGSELSCNFIHGSVNGLICLSCYRTIGDNERILQIWNPSLSAMLTLPPYGNTFGYTDENFIQYGFGYDPKTDDYKVIKFITPKRMLRLINDWFIDLDDINLSCGKIQVEIYGLRKCSWESITERFPQNVTRIVDRDEVFVDGHDGHLHWLGDVGERGEQETIVAFDLGDESFSEICLPFNKVNRGNTLGILGGKLCVMSCVQDHDCEVWVMNEYGIVESWTKHHAFSQFSFYIYPYGFTLKNEFLFEPTSGDSFRLALYDPNESKVKYFEYQGRMFSNLKVVVYVDSLVWIAPRGSTSRKD